VFGSESISFSTGKDFNVTAAGNINLHGKSVNLAASSEVKITSGGNLHLFGTTTSYLSGGTEVHVNGAAHLVLSGAKIDLNGPPAQCAGSAGTPSIVPAHEQFDKKFFLFGMNVAKDSIIKHQKAIVVEGQFDTACAHRYGFGVTVGLLGSAFSPYHLCIIARYCRDIFLSFDSDDSGFKNLSRSVKMYREYGLESKGIRFIPVVLPKHKDPDEFLKKESSNDYLELLREAKAKVEELGLKKYCLGLSNKYSQIEID
jgi:hypothetical protein